MNVADIKRRVTNALGDDAKLIFEDPDLIDMINDAQVDICRKTGFLTNDTSISLLKGTQGYPLPDDCIEVLRATYQNNKLYKTTWQEVDMLDPGKDTQTTLGVPDHYYIIGNTIYFYPPPSAGSILSVHVLYTRTPTALANDTDNPELPLAFHEDIVIRCVARGHEQVEDFQASAAKASEYNTAISLTIEQARNANDESYPYVRDIE